MADKSILGFSTYTGIQRPQHFSESRALTEPQPLNTRFPNSTWLSNCTGYTPTEILQLNLVTKEIQELQKTQTLFCVTEDFFFSRLQKERRSHKEHKQYKEQAVISIHNSTSFEDLHKQINQHQASFYPFFLQHLYFSQNSTDLIITFKLRELTLCVLP